MKKVQCEACEYKGYSLEICRYHSAKGGFCNTGDSGEHQLLKKMGKAVAWGAGAGMAAMVAGIGLAPLIGLHAILGHAAAKMTMGGLAGAGVNVARHWKKGDGKPKPKAAQKKVAQKKADRKKAFLLPMYLKG